MDASEPRNPGPLADINVLDLTHFAAGPVGTMILADMGAETIKVEHPVTGDMLRNTLPLVEDIGGSFPFPNRNKKSITLDLQNSKGKELFRRLVKWADIVVENFRPGVMARLGFSYENLSQINPRVVLVSISGFGQDGPYAERAAFDTVAQAIGGMMALTGRAVGFPISAGAVIGDNTGGLFGTIGALLALHHRERTGKGQWVDASMMEGQLYHIGIPVVLQARRYYSELPQGAGSAMSLTFEMKNGSYMVIMCIEDNHFTRLCRLIGRPDLAEDPEYSTRAKRQPRAEDIHNVVQEWCRTITAAEAEPLLDSARLPFARVMTITDLLDDPHVKARNAIEFVKQPSGEVLPLVGVFPKLSASPGSIRFACPRLGEHNEEVYQGVLGLSREEIESLRAEKVI